MNQILNVSRPVGEEIDKVCHGIVGAFCTAEKGDIKLSIKLLRSTSDLAFTKRNRNEAFAD